MKKPSQFEKTLVKSVSQMPTKTAASRGQRRGSHRMPIETEIATATATRTAAMYSPPPAGAPVSTAARAISPAAMRGSFPSGLTSVMPRDLWNSPAAGVRSGSESVPSTMMRSPAGVMSERRPVPRTQRQRGGAASTSRKSPKEAAVRYDDSLVAKARAHSAAQATSSAVRGRSM